MIEFLKKNKFGRATFLPLTQIRSHGGIAQPQALNEEGVIGLADTLVMVEDKYLELAGSLLGRTLVSIILITDLPLQENTGSLFEL